MAFCLIRHAPSSFFSPRRSRKSICVTLFQNNAFTYNSSTYSPSTQTHETPQHSTDSLSSLLDCNAALIHWQEKHSLSGYWHTAGRRHTNSSFILVVLLFQLDSQRLISHVISPASAPMAFLSPPLQQYKISPLESSSSKHSDLSTTAILT